MNIAQAAVTVENHAVDSVQACPCCSGHPYTDCCRPIIEGRHAPTAEALVRSRYTAFAVKRLDHVDNTHAPEIKGDFNRAEAERLAEEAEWKSLRIHKATEEGDEAEVVYVMQIRRQGAIITKAAQSRFRRENGEWLFVSTKAAPQLEQARSTKVNRNDPCSCGSGKKFKKCHGAGTES